jgi:hypothetical protein
MTGPDGLDALPDRLARQPFRAKFSLRGPERATVAERGLGTMRVHTGEIITGRLAPAEPVKDGRQTPYRGHPVFVAQHATATCCRTCLARWHGIGKGAVLTAEQRRYVVDVIARWIERQISAE